MSDPRLQARLKDDRSIVMNYVLNLLRDCPRKSAYEKALRACDENDGDKLQHLLLEHGLKQPCCDGRTHGLMHYAALMDADTCIMVLYATLWNSDWMPGSEKIFIGSVCEHYSNAGSHGTIGGWSRHAPPRHHRQLSALRVAVRNFRLKAITALLECSDYDVADEDLFADMFAVLDDFPRNAEDVMVVCAQDLMDAKLRLEVFEQAVRRNKLGLVRQLIGRPETGFYFDREKMSSLACSDDMLDMVMDLYGEYWDVMTSLCGYIRQHEHRQALWMIRTYQWAMLKDDCEYGTRALLAAADVGCTQVIHELLDIGVPIDAEGEDGITAIHQACASRNCTSEALELLINRGADVNLRIINGGGVRDNNPKSNAYSNDEDMANSLAVGDSPLHAVCIANTPFEEASRRVRILVQAGADVNAQNDEGDTALHCDGWRVIFDVPDYHKTSLRWLLLSFGADPSILTFGDNAHTSQQIVNGKVKLNADDQLIVEADDEEL